LSDRTFTAGIWTISGRLLAKSLDFVVLIILARLLSPADFGLVAMAMTAVTIAEAVLELPLTQVLIQLPDPTKPMFDTAFTLSLLRGAVIGLILAALSLPISWLYGEPRLPTLICALSLAPILRGSQSPRLVVFLKRMDFRRDFAINLVGKIAAILISTLIAFETGSYWAIAAGTIVTPLTMNVLSYCFAPYSPRFELSEWPRFKKTVSWNSVSQFMTAVNWQMDRILLGRFVSEAAFGKFAIASDLVGIPFQSLVVPITAPFLPAFASRVGSVSIGAAYRKASNAVFSIAAPVFLSMSLLAEPLIRLVLGEYWLEAVPFLRWLSLIALIVLPVSPMTSLALAMDHARMIAVRTAIELVLKVPITLVAILGFGVMGAIVSRGILAVVVLIVSIGVVKKLAGVSIWGQLTALWRTTVALGAMALCLALFDPTSTAHLNSLQLGLSLAAATFVSGVAYIAVLFGLWRTCGSPAGVEETTVRTFKSFMGRIQRAA
jgi:O-antigen/teichoic acid export membrane protein